MVKFRSGVTLALALVAGTLAACNQLYVRSDVNTALLATVHCSTFAWAGSFNGTSPVRNTIANPINEARLRTAIASHLKGGVQDNPATADCLIGYGIGANSVVDWPYYGGLGPYPWGYPYGYGGWWGWPGPYVYRQGIVAIDLYDAKSRQPLWHASVDQDLTGATGPEAEKLIDTAVAALFSRYPG